jgi:integrase
MTTLHNALRRYAREVTPTKRGRYQELSRIRVLCRDPLSQRLLVSIRSSDMARWRDEVKQHWAPSTLNSYFALISQVYRTAASEWGYDGLHNPARGVRMPKDRPGRDRRVSEDEEALLLSLAPDWLGLAIVWAVETAMRRGEQLSLRREDINGRTAHIRKTKTGKPRIVPLSSRAMSLLPSLGGGCFDTRLFHYDLSQYVYYWRATRAKAGLEDVRWHDLRHTALSRMAEKGLDVLELMTISGHHSPLMLSRYVHLGVERLAAKLG